MRLIGGEAPAAFQVGEAHSMGLGYSSIIGQIGEIRKRQNKLDLMLDWVLGLKRWICQQ